MVSRVDLQAHGCLYPLLEIYLFTYLEDSEKLICTGIVEVESTLNLVALNPKP